MHSRHRLNYYSASLILLVGLSVRLAAQTAPAAKSPEEAVVLNKFVVTGSNIPTAADSTDAPVVVIGRQDIDQTGLNANLLQILRESIPAFAGRSNAGVTTSTKTPAAARRSRSTTSTRSSSSTAAVLP